ncbi:hypothetical protein JQ617_18330 [Bradyrhizobium sp. KB893862 SZCCT0404]|nr:hypothetical protein [Bradyrhizobium sp. KB893862 SZCCT0404]MBR1175918.1 hypothetical protein [Bradyrhizobium sp. KB893862 SZCCT0404]
MTSVLPSEMGDEPRALARRGAIYARSKPARNWRPAPCFGNDIVNDTI